MHSARRLCVRVYPSTLHDSIRTYGPATQCSARWTWSNGGELTNKVAISRSSPSSEPPAWLGEVYKRRRRRTVRLVELSIATLERAGEKPSLAAIARVSKTVDPKEPRGISESAILHNEEAFAFYHQHADRRRRLTPRPAPSRRTDAGVDNRIRVS